MPCYEGPLALLEEAVIFLLCGAEELARLWSLERALSRCGGDPTGSRAGGMASRYGHNCS
jgi:hypothetical protein